jgi:CheY-like chemotaxis protein/signal transduction histidine kinase/HAMP domain-containing protein
LAVFLKLLILLISDKIKAMNLIRNLKISYKLLLLFSLLLIPTIIFLAIVTNTVVQDKNEILEVKDDFNTVMMLSEVIHHFQEERAVTYGYIMSQGEEFGRRLNTQREETDAALRKLTYNIDHPNFQRNEIQLLSRLPEYRHKVDNLSMDLLEYNDFYQNVRGEFFTTLREEANLVNDQQLRSQIQSVVQLIYAKEYLGQIRTLSNIIFTSDTLSISRYNQLSNLHVLHNQHIQFFLQQATDTLRKHYNVILDNSEYLEISRLLNAVTQDPYADVSTLQVIDWHNRFTSTINQFRNLENYAFGSINLMLDSKLNKSNTVLLVYLLITLLFVTLAVIFSVVIVRYIIRTVQLLRQISADVGQGLNVSDIPAMGNDEFGVLAGSFRKVVERNQELARIASEIGEGNYEVNISLPVKNDILRNALVKMRNNLHALSEENKKRSWLLSGMSQLNDQMGGIQDIQFLSKKIMTFLCEYTGAELGALFIQNGRTIFHFSAGYGINGSANGSLSFKIGEGVAGEAALGKKPVVISNAPAGRFKIKTSLTETEPVGVMIIPAVYEDEPVGVIEIVSRNGFTALHQQFLSDASERIAIALRTLKSNIETQELLHETQSQAEELENQQQELRQINNELQKQRDELEASGEELQASQLELQAKNAELHEKSADLEEQYKILSIKNQELEEARQVIELKIKQVEAISGYKTEFLANMSHELRTPLNSILLLSRILVDNASLKGNEKDAEHAKIIHNAGGDLLKLINEILDLSRVESGQIELDVQQFPVRSLDVPKEFEEQAKEKNIEYHIQVESNVPEQIKTDQFRLEQILRNLLSNAFKFTRRNGKVELHIYKVEDQVGPLPDDHKGTSGLVAFAIKDNGVGIPKEKQEAIFEAFKQADASTTRKYGGTGLGLSISRELSHLLGGKLHLESEPGRGSTFTLFLPVEPVGNNGKTNGSHAVIPDAGNHVAASVADAPLHFHEKSLNEQENGTSIMIIEDDMAFNNVLADFARSKQFKVVQAYTGTDGLEKLHDSPPDALLLDVKLPDMTGWDILRNMINTNLLKRVQVHLMTSYDYKNELPEHKAFNSYLQKPVTLESISKAFLRIAGKNNPIKKMLIVEDNKVENHAIAELLTSHQISTYSAFSGSEAIEKIEMDKPDGVILDLVLPDMEGYDVMEEIREKDIDLPIIVYSGKEISKQEERKLKKYANTIIIKNNYSYVRLMDEVKLFLHQIDKQLADKDHFKIDLHVPDVVLRDRKVLLVDDDVRNIYSLYSFLEKEGMKISVANDGKEAIEKLEQEQHVDIILMDIMMPEMDGIEAIKRIKKMPAFKNVPVIAITAKAMMEDRENCIRAGASDYVSKPINIEKLISLMRVWVYDATR